MKRKRFPEEQIIAVSREQEAGAKVADVCRKHGISDATFYNWKAKYGGMDVSDAKRQKALEEENERLKKLPAEQMLDAAALRGLLSTRSQRVALSCRWQAPTSPAPTTTARPATMQQRMAETRRSVLTRTRQCHSRT